jgi:hypothetical protein
MVSMDDEYPLLKGIGEILDNELQHHRMYDEFLKLGLPPEEFYEDADSKSFSRARRELRTLTPAAPLETFFRLFVTVIAPGGVGDEADRQKLRSFLKTRFSGQTWQILMEIEAEFLAWRQDHSLDVGPSQSQTLLTTRCAISASVGIPPSEPGRSCAGATITLSSQLRQA